MAVCLFAQPLSAFCSPLFPIAFPTENTALLTRHPENFYMYVERSFEGETSKPWQGGTYGFVRNPVRLANGTIAYSRLHAGIDISPVRRDTKGIPLDPIRTIADGRVVYVNDSPSKSTYGRYIVIEHLWEGCRYYSLYAHLASTSVKAGQAVRCGTPIAILGYSGTGLNRERAHLHLEITMLWNENFSLEVEPPVRADCVAAIPAVLPTRTGGLQPSLIPPVLLPTTPSPTPPPPINPHGKFNGQNLVGIPPTQFLLDASRNEIFSISQYIRRCGSPCYRIAFPQTPKFSLVKRYPWLCSIGITSSPGWEITFTREGVPLSATPLAKAPSKPTLTWVKPTTGMPYRTLSSALTAAPNGSATLSQQGLRLIAIITGDL